MIMQFASILSQYGTCHVAVYVDGKVIDLQSSEVSIAGRPDPIFDNLVSFLKTGEYGLDRAEMLTQQALMRGWWQESEKITFLPPTIPSVFLGLGYNYKQLASHEGLAFNKKPELFTKLPGCAVGHNQPIQVPRGIDKIDYEAELGVVIGRTAKRVKVKDALKYVGGYTAVNDVTAKIIPRPPEAGSIIVPLKAVDSFGPMGPTLISTREIPDPQKLTMLCRVNGIEKQRFSTDDMVHSVAEVIEYVTERITLNPGDVITTGTSLGIGIVKKPPEFLKEGDVVEVQIEGYPFLRNKVQWEKE
jgi:2-keto-4-pentenoate hydratase/2-oxohepta-3-ene-1,7-dioic acid hydratase in catechol pathway